MNSVSMDPIAPSSLSDGPLATENEALVSAPSTNEAAVSAASVTEISSEAGKLSKDFPSAAGASVISGFIGLFTSAASAIQKLITAISGLVDKVAELVKALKLAPQASPPAQTPPATNPPATNPPTMSPPSTVPPSTTPPATSKSFADTMKAVLIPDKDGEVSEAQLDFAIAYYQLTQKDPAIGESFRKLYSDFRKSGSFIDSSVKKALNKLVEDGKLKKEDATHIQSIAFRAAQLDTDLEKLSGRGGGTTLKTGEAKLADAIKTAEATLAGIAGGSIKLPAVV